MGVSKTKEGIINKEIVNEASRQEIIRRYFRCKNEFLLGTLNKEALERMEKIMQESGLKEEDRKTVLIARQAAKQVEKDSEKGNKGFFAVLHWI